MSSLSCNKNTGSGEMEAIKIRLATAEKNIETLFDLRNKEDIGSRMAKLEYQMEETRKSIDVLSGEIKDLLALVNKGKGAYLGVTMFAAIVGGIAAKLFGIIGVALR